MSALERLLAGVLVLIALAAGSWFLLERYGAERYQAGHDAAVAAGELLRQAEADRNRETESDLRAQLHAADADAFKKEQEYASNLEAAQRRVRAGVDGLRCPAASPLPASAAAGDRPTAAAPAADREGPELVPEASAAILGDAADVAGLVRRYDQVIERFERCRAVNAK